jgi:hypothetical protein
MSKDCPMHKNNVKQEDAEFANAAWQEEQEAGLFLSILEEVMKSKSI